MAHKNLHTKPCVFTAPDKNELKLPTTSMPIKYTPTPPPVPLKVKLYIAVKCKNIYS